MIKTSVVGLLLVLGTLTSTVASSAPEARPPAIGDALPDLSLLTLNDAKRVLSDRDGPTVLVFFRGVW